MTTGLPDTAGPARENGWVAALASLLVGAGFLALWFWLLPQWLRLSVKPPREWWRWLGIVPSAMGFGVALRCVWDFGWTGRGTPAPMAPPQRLVAVGLYRHVRNPMYCGFALGWIALWFMFGHADPGLIMAVSLAALGVHLFVVFYEEPVLRNKFGEEYAQYCRNVPRWWPRWHGWQSPR